MSEEQGKFYQKYAPRCGRMFPNVIGDKAINNGNNTVLILFCPASKRPRTNDPEDGTAMEEDQHDGKTVPHLVELCNKC